MARFFDYEGMFARRESVITVIEDGKSVTMTLKDYKAKYQPNKGKRSKKANGEKANSVTAVEAEIMKVEKACKYLNSLKAFASNGYKQWGVIASQIMGIEGIRRPLGQVTAHYSGYCLPYMAQIKSMSRKNDSNLFQYINWLVNHFEIVKTNLDVLMHNISEGNVLSHYRSEKCITEQGRRLGLRILVQRSTAAMGDIEASLSVLRDLVINGVDVSEYNLKGKRIG